MSKNQRAILRGVDGEFIKHLSADEVDVYEVYAEQSRVLRSAVPCKGRVKLIYRLKERCLPEVEPSESPESPCSLNLADMEMLIEIGCEDARTPRALIERWIGHGLIAERGRRHGQHDLRRAAAFA